jgi:hypothetical protein
MKSNPETSKFIQEILLEAALDDRIESGMVDLTKELHMEVVIEKFIDSGMNHEMIEGILNEIAIKEAGKHPDRQAYNKDGWLVTFPSKEYRDAAIKKGTHSMSDPTHGRGGMNLYYKKKGKQKRQTHQDTTTDELPSNQQGSQQAQKPTTEVPPTNQTNDQPVSPGEKTSQPTTASSLPPSQPKQKDPSAEEPSANEPTQPQKSSSPSPSKKEPSASVGDVPPTQPESETQPEVDYASLSVEFAKSKGWTSTQ